MPTEKIDDHKTNNCNHPEHNPPMFRVYENGTYKHTCPACGEETIFTVNKPTL